MVTTEREIVKKALSDFFKSLMANSGAKNIPLIFENENGVRPVPPFLSIELRDIVRSDTPYIRTKIETIENKNYEVHFQPIRRDCTLRAFGANSEKIINEIRDLLYFDKFIDELRKKSKMSLNSVGDILESYSEKSNTNEIFFTLDFSINYTIKITLENTYIETVEITDEINDDAEIINLGG